MSRPARFDASALAAVLAPARAPEGLGREERVRWIGEVAKALLAKDDKASLFVGGALLAWLERGGSLERDFFKVTKPKSRRTPSAIWWEVAHPDERRDVDTPLGSSCFPSAEHDE